MRVAHGADRTWKYMYVFLLDIGSGNDLFSFQTKMNTHIYMRGAIKM